MSPIFWELNKLESTVEEPTIGGEELQAGLVDPSKDGEHKMDAEALETASGGVEEQVKLKGFKEDAVRIELKPEDGEQATPLVEGIESLEDAEPNVLTCEEATELRPLSGCPAEFGPPGV